MTDPLPPGTALEPSTDGDPVDKGQTFRRRVGTVAAASAAALIVGQLISLAQTVALARLLTPTEVGYFAAGTVVTSFVNNFVEGGLRAGLIHRENRIEDAAETVFRATLLIGVLMSLLALAMAPLIGWIFDSRTAGVVAASMAGGIFLFSLTNVPEALLQRAFSIRRRLIVGPAVATTFAVVSVSLAAAGLGVWSMVIGTYASSAVWVLTLWWLCDWRPGRGKADLPMYRQLVGYGLPMAIAQFADQTVKGVQAVATGRFLSVTSLGLFRYGERMAFLPVGAIVEIANNSLFPAYSRISSEPDRFRRAYLHALGLVMVVAVAISGLLLAIGEPLVVVVLGRDWQGAGLVLMAMSGLGVGTAMATSAEAIKGAGRTSLLNYVTGINVVLGIGLVLLLAPSFGLVGVGLSVSITALVVGLTYLAMARRILGVPRLAVLRSVVPPLVCGLVATGGVAALERQVFASPDRPLALGLALLVADGLAFLSIYALSLRLAAPASFSLIRALVNSSWSATQAKLSSFRSGD
ncbi:oligosaccharide flippase family protein [Nocardioides aurantiacus]|uniref:oligosaccharide flippase family protein n=1 Tax=Nocardioides aurantiacus TaxID=86796 RepID=UPI00403FAE74